ncbi:MAG: helix-turn-helix transcriptional regulator [Spirochaetia bacterium]|nr:helix-turn-helix transcriptional regulator [Spirochaetia bacterium]
MLSTHETHCPIAFALNIFGDHWSLLIMRDILFQKKKRYNEFLNSEEKISTNILADRLQRLEANRIIKKKRDTIDGKSFIYSPTDKGLDLLPVLLSIVRWSGKHDAKTGAPASFLRQLEKPMNDIERKIRSEFGARQV